MKRILLLISLFFTTMSAFSQSMDDVLNVLITNKVITQQQADSLRAEAALKLQNAEAAKKTFNPVTSRPIQFSGYTQVRYQLFEESNKTDGFDLRRARFDIKGNLTSFFAYRLQAEFAGSPKLLDAYAEIKLNDYFQITIGQFRIPFSLENLSSMNKFEVIDFSQAVDAFSARGKDVIGNQNGRDIGIQLGGAIIKTASKTWAEYRIGIFNGTGMNVADTANNAKDIVGRLIFYPVKNLSIGASWYDGWGQAIKPSAEYLGKSQERNRFGLEINYSAPRFTIKSEFINGTDGNTKKAGGYVLAGYFFIPQKLQLVGRYDVFDPNTSADDNRSTAYTAGVNYNFNTWSRLQTFYTFREEQGNAINNNYLSVQYQIGF